MTAAIASESLGNLNTLNLNLPSLSGITFDQLKEATEACGGSVVALPDAPVEPIEPQEPPKKRGRKKSPSSADMVVTSETVETKTSSFLDADQSPDPEEQKPIEPHSSRTLTADVMEEIQSRFEAFGFRIPMPSLSSWMPQTIRELEKTLSSWESIRIRANRLVMIPWSMREGYEIAPMLIREYDRPNDDQTDEAFSIGCDAAKELGTDANGAEYNPFAPDTQLGRAWIEGFKSGKTTREASIHPVQKSIEQKLWVDPQLTTKRDAVVSAAPTSAVAAPVQQSSRSTLAAYEAGRSSARQEAIDRILSELFAENATIKSLAEEIKELKTNLKELNETREEHVVKSNRLMDELEKVSKGEFQEGLPFGE